MPPSTSLLSLRLQLKIWRHGLVWFPSNASSASGGHCPHLQSAPTLKTSSELSCTCCFCCTCTRQSKNKWGLGSSWWAEVCAVHNETTLSSQLALSPHLLLAVLRIFVHYFCPAIAEHRQDLEEDLVFTCWNTWRYGYSCMVVCTTRLRAVLVSLQAALGWCQS